MASIQTTLVNNEVSKPLLIWQKVKRLLRLTPALVTAGFQFRYFAQAAELRAKG